MKDYGKFPTYEDVVNDYNELYKLIGNITTVEQLVELSSELMIEVNSIEVNQFVENNSNMSMKDVDFVRYESYGCLDFIYAHYENGKLKTILFDVFSEMLEDYFLEGVSIETLTEDFYNEQLHQDLYSVVFGEWY